MKLKHASYAAMLVGGLLLVFGLLIWTINKPDFVSETVKILRSTNAAVGGRRDLAYEREMVENARKAQSAYTDCLYASGMVCQQVQSVPFFVLGGSMILIAGLGLFAFARKPNAA